MTSSLSNSQLRALRYASAHRGYITCGSRGCDVAQSTAKSLTKLGLLEFVAASEWRHGEGNRVKYKVTNRGREVILIGCMFAKHYSEDES